MNDSNLLTTNPSISFGELLKTIRLRAGFFTLEDLSYQLSNSGLIIDPSLISHWQRGARLPKDRTTILILIEIFIRARGITSPGEANRFTELAGMGYLTPKEIEALFPQQPLPSNVLKKSNLDLKIYFNVSARGKDQLGDKYEQIYDFLRQQKFILLDETEPTSDEFYTDEEKRIQIYENAIKYVHLADVLLLEVSLPSLSMGYLLHMALSLNKPVIALYTKASLPPYFAFLINDKNLQVIYYESKNLTEQLSQAIEFARQRPMKTL